MSEQAEERVITSLDNNPPTDEEILHGELAEKYSYIIDGYNDTLKTADGMPSVVEDDEAQKKISDFILRITGCSKTLEGSRSAEKEPHLKKGRAIDGFFKSRMETLAELKKKIQEPAAKYAKEKEDRKRREAEEKAKEEREEAERKRKEAEAKAEAAEEARKKAEEEKAEILRKAEELRKKAEADKEAIRKKAEEEAQAIRDKAAADKAAADAEIERLKKEQDDKDESQKQALKEAQEKADNAEKAQKVAEREAKNVHKDAEKEVRATEKDLRKSEKADDEYEKQLNRDTKALNREANAAEDDANRTDRYANKAEKGAQVKGSILSRTRGQGSTSSVTETWVGSVISREELDIEALREHIPMDALDKAVNAYVRAGGRELKGAIITEETKFAVRG